MKLKSVKKKLTKKNNGYSLIEMLAVMVLIVIIFLIARGVFVNVNKVKDKANSLESENVKNTAVTYLKEYSSELDEGWHYEYNSDNTPNLSLKYYCVTLNELVNSGYFSKTIFEKYNANTYVKVIKNLDDKTYTTGEIVNSDSSNSCEKYTVTFVDKDNNLIVIDGQEQKMTVDGGYSLTSSDFPNIGSIEKYNKFVQGSSTFTWNGKWSNASGKNVDEEYKINQDEVITMKYSLQSGSGDAYMLKKGHQRPFNGASDDTLRYISAGNITLCDNDGTTLADFVINCTTDECVLALGGDKILNYLTSDSKLIIGEYNNFDWYVLKYVKGDGFWHLDGQEISPINVGFLNENKLENSKYAYCRNINNADFCNFDSYNLAFTLYDDLEITSVTVNYNNRESVKYDSNDLKKVDDKGKDNSYISTGLGYYLKSGINSNKVKNISSVVVNYKKDNVSNNIRYNYSYNQGMYLFFIE